ncbi:hypothetical protein SELMODRAFT_422027 [Selaginella moellendorffii]|uniref:Gnk2-homologous domain-containing protein n=1 Tax=Selaginella moellendorffii TaxID=88036 RepID=D8SH42_SELML|nr:hypothetical protein SELMODRAFT_432634 [Selaginella moellendorffii]EFJ16456.1 hypothetical protein SELMODRAFT_422027 [Selaginella moellendorffii]
MTLLHTMLLLTSFIFSHHHQTLATLIESSCWNCGREKYSRAPPLLLSYSTALDDLLAFLPPSPVTSGAPLPAAMANSQLTESSSAARTCPEIPVTKTQPRPPAPEALKLGSSSTAATSSTITILSSPSWTRLLYNGQNVNSAMVVLSSHGSSTTVTSGDGKSRVFGLRECRRDMSAEQCNTCMAVATKNLHRETCYARFDTFLFYSSFSRESGSRGSRKTILKMVLGVATGGTVSLGIMIFCCLRIKHRYLNPGRTCVNVGSNHLPMKAAFSDDKKLHVEWSTRKIDIKRPTTELRKGKHEFLNEVRLVSSVQHRNLVKLYGTEESKGCWCSSSWRTTAWPKSCLVRAKPIS